MKACLHHLLGSHSLSAMTPPPRDRTDFDEASRVVRAAGEGDKRAAAELLPLVYEELRRLASSRLSALPPGQTLQATALVHDAYMRLVGEADPGWNGRAHFFGAAAQAMRNILVDQARRKSAVKHGGDRRRIELDENAAPELTIEIAPGEVLSLDVALERLEVEHPRQSRVVLLRYFAGLSTEQIAELLDVGASTIKRDWRFARAWLQREMREGDSAGTSDA